MEYQSLKTLYYGDRDTYTNTYLSRLHSTDAVMLDFSIGDKQAFFVENTEVLRVTREILYLDKAVSRLCAALPGIAKEQYSKKCLIDEIVLTNQIEGVHSSRRDISEALHILEAQSAKRGPRNRNRFLSLVKMYLLLRENQTLRLETCQDVRAIYETALLPEIVAENPSHAPDGVLFRRDLAELYSPSGKVLHRGLYPEAHIIAAMEKALAFLRNEGVDALYRVCLFHYFLEYIHPFYDGNGRLGRLLLSFGLSERLEPLVGFKISETIRENQRDYYEAFKICNDSRNLGDLTPFLLMLLSMVRNALSDLSTSLSKRLHRWSEYEKLVQSFALPEDKTGRNLNRMYSLLIQAALFSEDGISNQELTAFFGSAYHVKKILEELPPSQLIRRKKGREIFYSLNLTALDNLLLEQKLSD